MSARLEVSETRATRPWGGGGAGFETAPAGATIIWTARPAAMTADTITTSAAPKRMLPWSRIPEKARRGRR